MGLTAVLQQEDGTRLASVEDPTNILHRVLPSPEDRTYRYLNEIDWYGDTTFNWIQCAGLRKELERIAEVATAPDDQALIRRLIEFATRCHSAQLHLKFYGD